MLLCMPLAYRCSPKKTERVVEEILSTGNKNNVVQVHVHVYPARLIAQTLLQLLKLLFTVNTQYKRNRKINNFFLLNYVTITKAAIQLQTAPRLQHINHSSLCGLHGAHFFHNFETHNVHTASTVLLLSFLQFKIIRPNNNNNKDNDAPWFFSLLLCSHNSAKMYSYQSGMSNIK